MKKHHFVCPQCHKTLDDDDTCIECRENFPKLGDVPWLVPQPKANLQDWALRYRSFLQSLDDEINQLKVQGKIKQRLASSPKRMQKLMQAKIENKKFLEDLLAPLVKRGPSTTELYKAGGISAPPSQSLTGYYHNIHRDWSWETDENQLSLECITQILGDHSSSQNLGATVVLGAGAGRLGFDLHQTQMPQSTYLVDFNPLMLLVAHRVLERRSLKLFEFPLAPQSAADTQVLQKLTAPSEPKSHLYVIGGDALKTPFASQSVDTVVTPWLVDILPVDAALLIGEIHRILKPGGLWIYFGSMTFSHREISFNYSSDEFFELVKYFDFSIEKKEHRKIPYMASPHSNHSRVERVTTFLARSQDTQNKEALPSGNPGPGGLTKDLVREPELPPWLENFEVPVPRSPQIHSKNLVHHISAQLLSLVDGQRSLIQMADQCVALGLLEKDEAQAYWFRFLKRLHLEDSGIQGFKP
jgi:ubiquinone/menaquinone biosynthesis C-methylase UbiE